MNDMAKPAIDSIRPNPENTSNPPNDDWISDSERPSDASNPTMTIVAKNDIKMVPPISMPTPVKTALGSDPGAASAGLTSALGGW